MTEQEKQIEIRKFHLICWGQRSWYWMIGAWALAAMIIISLPYKVDPIITRSILTGILLVSWIVFIMANAYHGYREREIIEKIEEKPKEDHRNLQRCGCGNDRIYAITVPVSQIGSVNWGKGLHDLDEKASILLRLCLHCGHLWMDPDDKCYLEDLLK